MGIKVYTEDKTIWVTFQNVNNFNLVLSTVKQYKKSYDPNLKRWEINPHKANDLLKDLETLEESELLEIENKIEEKITQFTNIPSEIKYYRSFIERGNLKVPPIMGKAPYEDYQMEDIFYLTSRNRFALFNKQGTGKSYEFISALDYYSARKKIQKVLILSSGSGTYNMYKELQKFSTIDMKKVAIAGVDNREPFIPEIDIVLSSYRSFLLVSDHAYKKKFPKKEVVNYRKCPLPFEDWIAPTGVDSALILDESHLISNPRARSSKVLRLAAPFFEYRYLATGTPADRYEKYYNQLWMMDRSLVKNMDYQDWLNEYAKVGTKFSDWAIDYFRPEKIVELQKIIRGVSVRRLADKVLNLPINLIQPYYVPFKPLQKEIYQTLVFEKLKKLKEAEGALETRKVALYFQYLLLAIDNPKILLNHEDKIENQTLLHKIKTFDFQKDHSKLEALRDIIDKHPTSKIIIWNSHPSVAEELYLFLKEFNPLMIHGKSLIPPKTTKDQFKSQIIQQFIKSKEHRILIAGLQVLNTSVTIVEANVQIVFDSDFNYTIFDQAMKRMHRIGQVQNVYTYYIAVDHSLDVVRKMNLDDKEYFDKTFLSESFLSKENLHNIFNMEGK